MAKKAVIIYGPPGSGKGTQAELLARKYNFIHFDTGRYIESLVRASGWQKNAVLRRQRKLFDTGKLCEPWWVLKMSKQFAERLSKMGYSIVFSGSPRTLPEAFGTKNNGLVHALGKLYGKKNVVVVQLLVSEESSLKRNSHRLVCSVCGLPLLANAKIKQCAFCGGKMRTRSLDTSSVIKARLKEYRSRTFPIIREMRKRRFRVIGVNGEPPPYVVHKKIIEVLKLKK